MTHSRFDDKTIYAMVQSMADSIKTMHPLWKACEDCRAAPNCNDKCLKVITVRDAKHWADAISDELSKYLKDVEEEASKCDFLEEDDDDSSSN